MHTYLTIAFLTCAPTASWESNYGQAQQHAISQRKPLAVVFGPGANGWTTFLRTDSAAVQLDRLLAEHYVCVYLDTATASGKKLAQAFEINTNVGLVISDRSGASQSFWHQGDMTSDDMLRYLIKHADARVVLKTSEALNPPKAVVKPAETPPIIRTSYYPATSTYAQAQQDAIRLKRPLAVVFGRGANGWTNILRAESPTPQVEKLLAELYVCVYVDTETAAGKELSQTFAINDKVGLVISDRSGGSQAFWHQGDMTSGNMIYYLTKYADAQVAVTQTEAPSLNRASYYSGSPTYSNGSSRTISSANC